MPEQPQSARNHVSRDWVHLPVLLILTLNVLVSVVWSFVAHSPRVPLRMWLVIVSIALLLSSLKARTNAIRVQDRLIRLEERLRYQALLSPAQVAAASALPLTKLIALRFASDLELPSLLDRTLVQDLSPQQIKAAIADWRPDMHRV